jgi:hypothetical protein
MKRKLFIVLLIFTALISCNDTKNYPATDIDVARAFIKDILNNDYKDAKKFVLDEEMNNQYFELSKKEFEGKSKDELDKYKNADIIINELKSLNDSVTIVNYSNSYKKDVKNEVKVVRVNSQWQVDLKHTFQEAAPVAK